MLTVVHTRTYDAPPIDKEEALRYAGVRAGNDEIERLLQIVIDENADDLTYKACMSAFALHTNGDAVDLGFSEVVSADLRRCLDGCSHIVLFAATIGLPIDRSIARYGAQSATRAVLLQAFGTERIEGLCDAVCRDIHTQARAHGYTVTPRFSPGYGDLPLSLQRDIVRVLDTPRRIGLTLNDSLLMSPAKSVTALVGLKKEIS